MLLCLCQVGTAGSIAHSMTITFLPLTMHPLHYLRRTLTACAMLMACASVSAQPSRPLPDAPPMAPAGASYLLPSQLDWIGLLPPPPAAHSAEQQRDLQQVLDIQAANRNNIPARERAMGDAQLSCLRIASVLNPDLDDKKVPITATFLTKAASDGIQASIELKHYWHRTRPYAASNEVEHLGEIAMRDTAAAGMNNPRGNDSYPSGHATVGTLCGWLLAQMVPEKQAEIYARTEQYRQSRLIVGAHFPSDLEGGRLVGTAAAALMSQNWTFQRDLAAARNELRRALKLPEMPAARAAAAP